MKHRAGLVIALGVLAVVSALSVTAFFAHRTFTTTGHRAVTVMNAEERAALELPLGPPSEHVYLMANGIVFLTRRTYEP